MLVRWTTVDGYTTIIPREKISACVVEPNGIISIYVSGASDEEAFYVNLYKDYRELANRIVLDIFNSNKGIIELPSLEKIKEYFNGQSKND